ncbi:MAG: DUF4339 domain-containing protein, partial [Deltaproteobacteria bacterium]|nr:DUF4339 domain-containing protein [Deltaproteobacteria bacterium]MBW2537326.1 DUF4339 domain-containing protein [Deltaproteobacteria bacterium]
MAPSDQWRWTDEDGVQRLLDAEELRAALADGRLKPTTLVWRRGMKRWLPAGSVPELASTPGADGESASAAKSLGDVAQPTPSIPTVAQGTAATSGRPMPENLVDIEALRSKSRRRRKNTLPGTGGGDEGPESATSQRVSDEDDGATTLQREEASSPGPAKDREGSAAETVRRPRGSNRGRRRKITRLGGPWSSQEAEDDTTTYVREELEEQKRKRDEERAKGSTDSADGPETAQRASAEPATARKPGSPSVPPLVPSLSPPAPGGGKDRVIPGRKGRPSGPPPPRGARFKTQKGFKAPATGKDAAAGGRERKRSIPPPAPKRRSGKSLPPKGKPAAKTQPAAGAAAAKPADQSPVPAKAAAAQMAQASGGMAATPPVDASGAAPE